MMERFERKVEVSSGIAGLREAVREKAAERSATVQVDQHTPEMQATRERQDAEKLAEVRQRLGMEQQAVRNEPTIENPAENLESDPLYQNIRWMYERRRPDKNTRQLDLEAEREFERTHPDRAKYYAHAEKSRVYRDVRGNPSLKDDATYKRMFLPQDFGGNGFGSDGASEMRARMRLASQYPEKAKAYAETDEMLGRVMRNR